MLDAGRCIPESSCGCLFEEKLFFPGEQFWRDSRCTSYCICNEESDQVSCHRAQCRVGEQCKVEQGLQNCYPASYAMSSASGNSHYVSFDGQRFDFRGDCVYQFTGLCVKRFGLVDFLVLVQSNYQSNQSLSFPQSVEINVYNTSIVISRKHLAKVMVSVLDILHFLMVNSFFPAQLCHLYLHLLHILFLTMMLTKYWGLCSLQDGQAFLIKLILKHAVLSSYL